MYEKEKEATEAHGEVIHLKRALKEADDQCLLLFGEVQKAWKLAASLQAELTSHESHINKLQVVLPYRFLLLTPEILKSLLSSNFDKVVIYHHLKNLEANIAQTLGVAFKVGVAILFRGATVKWFGSKGADDGGTMFSR